MNCKPPPPQDTTWLPIPLFCPPPFYTLTPLENKNAFVPDCGVHYLWFAFVCFLIRSPPLLQPSSIHTAWCHKQQAGSPYPDDSIVGRKWVL